MSFVLRQYIQRPKLWAILMKKQNVEIPCRKQDRRFGVFGSQFNQPAVKRVRFVSTVRHFVYAIEKSGCYSGRVGFGRKAEDINTTAIQTTRDANAAVIH